MAFTYTDSPATVPRDAVRLLIGDTDSTDPLLSDAEVDYYLSENGSNTYRAASEACQAIVSKLARTPDFSTVSVKITNSERAARFETLAKTLSEKFLAGTVMPFAGGISKASKQAYEDDTDRVEPFFMRQTHTAPGTENPLAPTRTE